MVIVAGIGLNKAASEAAIERLPGAVVLAIDAYAARPDAWARSARLAGHELLATVPLQEASSNLRDRGPRALRAMASADENGKSLRASLGAFSGYVGVLTVGGTAFRADDGALEPLLAAARSRGLLLVDAAAGGEESPLVRPKAAPALPVVHIDVVLDPAEIGTIDRQLADLQKIAGARSSGVALAYPSPATFERLRAWISTLDDRRYVLTPVSAVIDAKAAP